MPDVTAGCHARGVPRLCNNSATIGQDARGFGSFHDHRRDSFGRDLPEKIMSIEAVAPQGKEQVAQLGLPRIGANAAAGRAGKTGQEFASASQANKLKGARLHISFPGEASGHLCGYGP